MLGLLPTCASSGESVSRSSQPAGSPSTRSSCTRGAAKQMTTGGESRTKWQQERTTEEQDGTRQGEPPAASGRRRAGAPAPRRRLDASHTAPFAVPPTGPPVAGAAHPGPPVAGAARPGPPVAGAAPPCRPTFCFCGGACTRQPSCCAAPRYARSLPMWYDPTTNSVAARHGGSRHGKLWRTRSKSGDWQTSWWPVGFWQAGRRGGGQASLRCTIPPATWLLCRLFRHACCERCDHVALGREAPARLAVGGVEPARRDACTRGCIQARAGGVAGDGKGWLAGLLARASNQPPLRDLWRRNQSRAPPRLTPERQLPGHAAPGARPCRRASGSLRCAARW